MPSIDTLVHDIHDVLTGGSRLSGESLSDLSTSFGSDLALKIVERVASPREERVRDPKTLYMSEFGKPCMRQIWYGVNEPEHAEAMPDKTQVKFLYGDILEDMVLTLARAAGHAVERNQERCEFHIGSWTIRGRIDAVVDGVLVDVKSASKYSFDKFQRGLDDSNDSFGYRAQLSGYNYALHLDSPVRQGFLVIEKTNGDIAYVDSNSGFDVRARASAVVECVESAKPPERQFDDVAEGSSGNRTLGVECSYCPYKHECWQDANTGRGLRTFLFSTGPKFLTRVDREPKVMEVV